MRQRFGTRLIPMKDTFRDMIKNKDELNATAFIADQSPSPVKAHWMQFLNQETAVFLGTEKIAEKVKYPIVYVSVKKLTRGYYTLTAAQLQLPPYTGAEGDITAAHTQKLEADTCYKAFCKRNTDQELGAHYYHPYTFDSCTYW